VSAFGESNLDVYYSDRYTLELPESNRFPKVKYQLLRDYLLSEKILRSDEIRESPLAAPEVLKLAHTGDYVESMRTGTVSQEILKSIGFPWSPALYARSCATVGGAIESAKSALRNGIAGNLAGGAHHSHADRGGGYCVFNDIAVAARYLRQHRLAERIAIVDLDVHQGNGNSSILGQDVDLFIFSMHGEKNYPFRKVPSHLDIGLPNDTGDDEYLLNLDRGLREVGQFGPDFIFYQMGVDPLKEDSLGKLSLTFDGLMERDRRVLRLARSRKIPVSLALGGGYAKPIELSVQAYANTYRVVQSLYFSSTPKSETN